MRLRISSRQSDLARIQAYLVGEAIRAAHPNLETGLDIEFRFRESLGDVNQTDPLWKMPEKGVFTEDFISDLTTGETDLVVHSWKDLPIADRADTEIVATLPRADARDVLLLKKSAWSRVSSSGKLRVYSSSPRRARNLDGFLRDFLPATLESVEFVPVRGNIPTRVRKLFEDDSIDALIVAKAAIDRLLSPVPGAPADEVDKFATTAVQLRKKLDEARWMVLPLSENPTAAAQGALAIEIRKDRADLRKLLAAIHCEKTARTVRREREILASYGGGCHQKIGITILARDYGDITFLRGETDAGKVLDKSELSASTPASDRIARTAWPLPDDGDSVYGEGFYERRSLGLAAAQFYKHSEGRALWIARANALPETVTLDDETVVWTAGLATWSKLARHGVWVNGSSEGLGESEAPEIDRLLGQVALWLKLTHSPVPGLSESTGMPELFTYDLLPRAEVPNLAGKRDFYWMSGSAFVAALAKYPDIRGARHSSGPGRTHETLRAILGKDAKIGIELNYAAWLTRVKGTP
jgi:hydroxymethylbilane synthase